MDGQAGPAHIASRSSTRTHPAAAGGADGSVDAFSLGQGHQLVPGHLTDSQGVFNRGPGRQFDRQRCETVVS